MEVINLKSRLYNHTDQAVKGMMNFLDQSVPLLAGQGLRPDLLDSRITITAPLSSSVRLATASSSATSSSPTESPAVTSGGEIDTTDPPSPEDSGTDLPAAAGAGIALGVIVTVLLLAAGLYFLHRRRKQLRKQQPSAPRTAEEKAQLEDTPSTALADTSKYLVERPPAGGIYYEVSADQRVVYEMDPGDDGLVPEVTAGPLSNRSWTPIIWSTRIWNGSSVRTGLTCIPHKDV